MELVTLDPFERLEARIDAQMNEFEKKMDELGNKIFEGPPFPPLPGDDSSRGPPSPPRPPGITKLIDDFSDRMSDFGDRLIEPAREANMQINKEIDRTMESGKKAGKAMNKALFPINAVGSPALLVIFLKNAREHPEMSTDDLIENTYQETLGWALDVANIAWPGTAAPDAKEQVRKRIGGLVESYTGMDLFREGA